jgi:hypothetical protein
VAEGSGGVEAVLVAFDGHAGLLPGRVSSMGGSGLSINPGLWHSPGRHYGGWTACLDGSVS